MGNDKIIERTNTNTASTSATAFGGNGRREANAQGENRPLI
jgi:hypothetical protein